VLHEDTSHTALAPRPQALEGHDHFPRSEVSTSGIAANRADTNTKTRAKTKPLNELKLTLALKNLE
jgi:hypothetical protein